MIERAYRRAAVYCELEEVDADAMIVPTAPMPTVTLPTLTIGSCEASPPENPPGAW